MEHAAQGDQDKDGGAPRHRWPRWWDDVDHPDVPFPHFRLLLGEDPGPEEILRRARASVDARGDVDDHTCK